MSTLTDENASAVAIKTREPRLTSLAPTCLTALRSNTFPKRISTELLFLSPDTKQEWEEVDIIWEEFKIAFPQKRRWCNG